MFINAKVGLYFIRLKNKPFFKKKGNITIKLRKEGIVLRNMRNWFCFTLRKKIEYIYYALHLKIILLPKYLPFIP